MALKVVPAGDERCDIHTQRKPAQYICESCLAKFGVEAAGESAPRRSRSLKSRIRRARRRLRRWRAQPGRVVLIGGGAVALIAVIVLVVSAIAGGGGSDRRPAARTEAGVVSALGLLPSPGGTGWITPDGACWLVSIQFGANVQPGRLTGGLIEATNEDQTVGAAVTQNDFSISTTACAEQVGADLRANY